MEMRGLQEDQALRGREEFGSGPLKFGMPVAHAAADFSWAFGYTYPAQHSQGVSLHSCNVLKNSIC